MKRSRHVRLVLTGAIAGAALNACTPGSEAPPITANDTYTNNHQVRGVGYYHAPYHRWYPFPYNHHDPLRGYYYGGRWNPQPEPVATTASRPTSEAANLAQLQRTDARAPSYSGRSGSSGSSRHATSSRGGFGGSSRSTIS